MVHNVLWTATKNPLPTGINQNAKTVQLLPSESSTPERVRQEEELHVRRFMLDKFKVFAAPRELTSQNRLQSPNPRANHNFNTASGADQVSLGRLSFWNITCVGGGDVRAHMHAYISKSLLQT